MEEECNDIELKIETMEMQSSSTSLLLVCRLCANEADKLVGIYSKEGRTNEMADKINQYLPIKVSEADVLPLQCCLSCAQTILTWHELYTVCIEAEKKFTQIIIDDKEEEEDNSQVIEAEELIDDPEIDLETTENIEAMAETETASLNVLCQTAPNKKQKAKFVTSQIMWLKPHESGDYNLQALLSVEDYKLLKSHVGKEEGGVKNLKEEIECDESLVSYIEQSGLTEINLFGASKKSGSDVSVKEESLNMSDGIETIMNKSGTSGVAKKKNFKMEDFKEEFSSDEDGNAEAFSIKIENDICVYTCKLCNSKHMNEEGILNHIKTKHKEEDSKKERRKNTKLDQKAVNEAKVVVDGKVYYNCKICGKSLHSPYTYIWHMRIHTGERPFVCDLCGKQFRVSQGLVRHLKETHEGIKNFPCDLCGRMFATRRNVEEHRRIHTNERPYVCDLCGKAFKQKASLFVHNRSHTNSFPFRCSYCNQGFRTRPPLLLHITRHTGEKPYPCEVCGRCFRIKYELKRHMLIHSDEKPFTCSICGANFRQKRYLRNHTRINHNREST